MVFEAELEDIGLLRDAISVIADIIDETSVQITKDGLKLIASDRAVVVVIDFLLRKEVFKSYSFEKDETIGLNLISFLQILRRAQPEDVMKIKLDDNKLKIQLKGDSTRNFVMPLIDVSSEEMPPIDKLEFKAKFKLDANVLNSGIEDADIITDSVIFSVHENGVDMKAESDASLAELKLEKDKGGLKEHDSKEDVNARFSLDYLKKIIKSKKLAAEAELEMSSDYPMRIRFDVPGKMDLGFILAPRVEE